MSDGLIAFLNARVDEDELTARDSVEYLLDGAEIPGLDWYAMPDWARRHVGQWLPERVFREVEAKRLILNDHVGKMSEYGGHGFKRGGLACNACGWDDGWAGVAWPCSTVIALAVIWSGHPDYRQEWAALEPPSGQPVPPGVQQPPPAAVLRGQGAGQVRFRARCALWT